MLDLIFIDRNGERSLSAALPDQMIGPFPFKGAFEPIAKRLAEIDPEKYGDEKQTQLILTAIHFRNMAQHANAVGQVYPFPG